MIAAAGEWGGFDVADAHALADLLPPVELGGLGPTRHWQVVGRGPQVLTDGDDVHPDAGQVGQQTLDFADGFAEADHEAALRRETGLLRHGQHAEAARITGAGPNGALKAGHGLDVVVEHVGWGSEQQTEGIGLAVRIADEGLDRGGRAGLTDGRDARRNMGHPTVGQVVARHHRYHRVVQSHLRNGGGHPLGLVCRRWCRLVGIDQAEAARASAPLAEHHEGGCAIAPAVAEVGAPCLLAHGAQSVALHRLPERQHTWAVHHLGSQPFRFTGGDGQPCDHSSLLQPCRSACKRWRHATDAMVSGTAHSRTGPSTARERREVVGPQLPCDVLTFDLATRPQLRGSAGDDVDDRGH